MEDFLGYHSEWNLGSPGGWEYQRITQEVGKLAWRLLQPHLGWDIRLDFDHEFLNPVPAFAAASTFAVAPPIGRTVPLMLSEPVIAVSCLTGTPSIADITAVITDILAESPSNPS